MATVVGLITIATTATAMLVGDVTMADWAVDAHPDTSIMAVPHDWAVTVPLDVWVLAARERIVLAMPRVATWVVAADAWA